MSTQTFPTLRGLTWDLKLTPTYSSGIQQATSGREVRASYWSAPLHKISLVYEFLRDDAVATDDDDTNDAGYSELQQIVGLFYAMKGSFDTFTLDIAQLTKKPLESTITGQPIGTGDGSTTQFQLVRNVGGTLIAVQEPAGQIAAVSVAGVAKVQGTDYSVAKGVVAFAAAPAASAAITADFQWLWRVRFDKDEQEFANFMYQLWEAKQVDLIEVRQ